MNIVISGGGIAGLTLALALQRDGHRITVVEESGAIRDQGYMIDFFGYGFDVAEGLGLLEDLAKIHYPIDRLAFIGPDGNENFALPYRSLRKHLFRNRHFNFMRGDLERLLYSKVESRIDIRFGTTVESMQEDEDGICVELNSGSVLPADLLVGADGIHSQIRKLVFGNDSVFIRRLGYHAIAFVIDEPREESVKTIYTFTVPGKQVSVYPFRSGVATLFVHRDKTNVAVFSRNRALSELDRIYGRIGWRIPDLLKQCEQRPNVYFDDVSQVEMPIWHQGRVVLVGDACYCVSLLAGQGASMAMLGAYTLADELSHAKNVRTAMLNYESRMRPIIGRTQRAGSQMAKWFVPETPTRLTIRDWILRASTCPLFAPLIRRGIDPG